MMMKKDNLLELSAITVTFISWRGRLTKVLAGAARGETGSKGGGGQVRLSNVELAGFPGIKIQ